MLLEPDTSALCGGFLVAPQHVMTAAHCVGCNALSAFIGAICLDFDEGDDGNVFWPNCDQKWEINAISQVFVHPDYIEDTFDNDFALLKLASRLTINPVKIDNGFYSPTYKSSKGNLWVIGFGRTEEDNPNSLPSQLKHVELSYVTQTNCIIDYNLSNDTITENMMCAADPGEYPCNGDSGGPLYDSENDVVAGIVSFGVGCANPDYPEVYSRIASQFTSRRGIICSDDLWASICSSVIPTPMVTSVPTTRDTRRPTRMPTIPQFPRSDVSCDNKREMKIFVIVRTDDFPDETSWTISDPTGHVVARNTSSFIINEIHHQGVCLTRRCGIGGDYTFIIKDSYGDGIMNMGYFKLLVDGMRVDDLDAAVDFSERSFQINSCPSSTPSSPCSDKQIEVIVELKTDNFNSETLVEIRQARSGSTVVPPTKPRLPQRIMKETYCLEKIDDYLFHINDSRGDGLRDVGKDWDLSGHFKVFVDGDLVSGDSDGTDFGFNDTIVIGPRRKKGT